MSTLTFYINKLKIHSKSSNNVSEIQSIHNYYKDPKTIDNQIVKSQLQENYLCLEIEYSETDAYNNQLINKTDKTLMLNQRQEGTIEPNQQLFCIYDYNNNLLYTSKNDKNKNIKQLLEEPLVNHIVTIAPILDNLDDFLNKVQSIEIIDFMYFENDLFQDEKVKSIIDRMKDENGYDSSSKFSFNYTLKVAGEGNMTVDRFKEFIFNNKKNDKSKKITKLVGKDSSGFENIFNSKTFSQKISIKNLKKTKFGIYEPSIIYEELINQIENLSKNRN
jgi:hypothetical protein